MICRSQRISYVMETQGLFLLPARDYFWWDTGSGELKLLSLPATEILVGEGGATAAGSDASALDMHPLRLLAVAGGVFAEGVDYPGRMLQAVAVVGPCLPAVTLEAQLLRGTGVPYSIESFA